MKLLPSLFKTNKETTTTSDINIAAHHHHHHHHHHQPWQFYLPSCNNPKTLSFRAPQPPGNGDDIFKTINSVFFETTTTTTTNTTPEYSSSSSESASLISSSNDEVSEEFDGESLEMVVRGARSERSRLFFEPGDITSSIIKAKEEEQEEEEKQEEEEEEEEEEEDGGFGDPFKESLVVAMDSEDPYEDFRRSMKEMVECHGLKDDWDGLEQLLGWYLKVNGKTNHGFILGAFVNLLLNLSSSSSSSNSSNSSDSNSNTTTTTSSSFSSAVSSFCSSSTSTSTSTSLFMCPSSHHEIDDDDHELIKII